MSLGYRRLPDYSLVASSCVVVVEVYDRDGNYAESANPALTTDGEDHIPPGNLSAQSIAHMQLPVPTSRIF